MTITKKILFVCVENAGRSQMAEAFGKYYGKDKFIISSAGNKPSDKVNPVVVEAMKEKDIDISENKPRIINAQMAMEADLIVTMGCSSQGICPGPFFKPTVDWKLEDPKGKPIEKVREIRDQIEQLVQELIKKELRSKKHDAVYRIKRESTARNIRKRKRTQQGNAPSI